MTRWPKKWLDALVRPMRETCEVEWNERAEMLLASLRNVGALKEPPNPREWYIEKREDQIDRAYRPEETCAMPPNQFVRLVKVREVTEEL
jgi:hypothetical protein